MKRCPRWLLVILLGEFVAAVSYAAWHCSQPDLGEPPSPAWEQLESETAAELQSARAGCRSASDWRNLGELYMAAGCFREAERCHAVAAVLEPRNAVYQRDWGFALERLGCLDDADAAYRRAQQLDPRESDRYRYLIARNRLRAEQIDAALELFDQGRAHPANRYGRARALCRSGDSAAAAQHLQELLQVEPAALQVHLLGYRVRLEQGERRLARWHADRVRGAVKKLTNPFDDEAARIVGVTQRLGANRRWREVQQRITAGQLREAEQLLDGVERTPTAEELMAEIGFLGGRFDAAAESLARVQARQGSSARIWAKLGDVRQAQGAADAARDAWQRAAMLEVGVDLKTVHHKLADSYHKSGDEPRSTWHRARGHYYVGRDLFKFGYIDKSAPYFEAATRADPQFAQAWYYLGETRRYLNQKDAAASAYEACLRVAPDHGRALAARSW